MITHSLNYTFRREGGAAHPNLHLGNVYKGRAVVGAQQADYLDRVGVEVALVCRVPQPCTHPDRVNCVPQPCTHSRVNTQPFTHSRMNSRAEI